MPSVGDGSITVEVTGTGGLDAVMFTRVAPGNAQPVEGSTRSGDGPLTTSALKNRVPHEVVVQLKSGSNFGPASRVLLLTPRATGTSDYDAIRLEIRSLMSSRICWNVSSVFFESSRAMCPLMRIPCPSWKNGSVPSAP